MRMLLLFFFLCIVATSIYAQKDTTLTYLDPKGKPCTEQKAVRYAIQYFENNRWEKEVFDNYDDKIEEITFYKDAACTYMDGPYRNYYKNGNIKTAGQYMDNKKAGAWRIWDEDKHLTDSAYYSDGFIQGIALSWSKDGVITDSSIFGENGNGIKRGYWTKSILKETGNFVSGKKQGLWIYYYTTGIKCQEVNYEADSAVTYTCFDDRGNVQTKDCYYEKEASFKGGDKGWRDWLGKKLVSAPMPQAYEDGLIYGTVLIRFVVDIFGNVTDVRIEKSVAPQLDMIAVNIIKQSPQWESAVQYNRKVKAYRRQPLTFLKAGQ